MAKQVKIFNAHLPVLEDDVAENLAKALNQEVNDFLLQHPDADLTWLQSSGGYAASSSSRMRCDICTSLTAIVTYNPHREEKM